MKLLLHICCAPCSTEVLRRLMLEHDVTGFFYNPNIHPADEYLSRLNELERFSLKQNFPLIKADYDVGGWFETVRGLEDELEGGSRCEKCFRLRLEKTAKMATERGFEAFTTTLTISPHKNASLINAVGKDIGTEGQITFLESDFKKQNGYHKSVEQSKKHGMRRQNYCGCVYSQRQRKRWIGKPDSTSKTDP